MNNNINFQNGYPYDSFGYYNYYNQGQFYYQPQQIFVVNPQINNNYYINLNTTQPQPIQSTQKNPSQLSGSAKLFVPKVSVQALHPVMPPHSKIQKKDDITEKFHSLTLSEKKNTPLEQKRDSVLVPHTANNEKNAVDTQTVTMKNVWKTFDKGSLSQIKNQDLKKTVIKQSHTSSSSSANMSIEKINKIFIEEDIFSKCSISHALYSGPISEMEKLFHAQIVRCQTPSALLKVWKEALSKQYYKHYVEILDRYVSVRTDAQHDSEYQNMVDLSVARCISFMHELDAPHLVKFLNAAIKLLTQKNYEDVIKKIDLLLANNGHQAILQATDCESLSRIAYAFGKGGNGIVNNKTLTAIEFRLLNNDSRIPIFYNDGYSEVAPHFLPQKLVRLACGFGAAQIHSVRLFSLIKNLLLRNNGYLLTQINELRQFSILIYSFCTQDMDCRDLLKPISDILLKNKNSFKLSNIDLTMMISGIVEASYISEENRRDIYGCSNLLAMMIAWVEEMARTDRDFINKEVATVCKKLEFAYPDFAKKYILPGSLLKKKMDEYDAKMKSDVQFRMESLSSSKSQSAVATYLKKEYMQEAYIDGGFIVDFYNPKTQEIIEFNGPPHFFNNLPNVATIRSRFKIMLLENRRYTVKNINHQDWQGKKHRYCIKKYVGKHALRS